MSENTPYDPNDILDSSETNNETTESTTNVNDDTVLATIPLSMNSLFIVLAIVVLVLVLNAVGLINNIASLVLIVIGFIVIMGYNVHKYKESETVNEETTDMQPVSTTNNNSDEIVSELKKIQTSLETHSHGDETDETVDAEGKVIDQIKSEVSDNLDATISNAVSNSQEIKDFNDQRVESIADEAARKAVDKLTSGSFRFSYVSDEKEESSDVQYNADGSVVTTTDPSDPTTCTDGAPTWEHYLRRHGLLYDSCGNQIENQLDTAIKYIVLKSPPVKTISDKDMPNSDHTLMLTGGNSSDLDILRSLTTIEKVIVRKKDGSVINDVSIRKNELGDGSTLVSPNTTAVTVPLYDSTNKNVFVMGYNTMKQDGKTMRVEGVNSDALIIELNVAHKTSELQSIEIVSPFNIQNSELRLLNQNKLPVHGDMLGKVFTVPDAHNINLFIMNSDTTADDVAVTSDTDSAYTVEGQYSVNKIFIPDAPNNREEIAKAHATKFGNEITCDESLNEPAEQKTQETFMNMGLLQQQFDATRLVERLTMRNRPISHDLI
jgi:hypothetical protein